MAAAPEADLRFLTPGAAAGHRVIAGTDKASPILAIQPKEAAPTTRLFTD